MHSDVSVNVGRPQVPAPKIEPDPSIGILEATLSTVRLPVGMDQP
jgi:hypothetical protein